MLVVVSVTIMLVDHFVAALMQKAVSAAENMGDNFYCNYAVGSLLQIIQVVLSAVLYAHDCFYCHYEDDCFCHSYVGDSFK